VWRYAHYAWGEPDTWGGNAQTFWNAGPQLPLPLQQFPNGGGVAPRQGDIMVFGPGWLGSYWDGAGHVAVVRDVGSNYVDVVEQNATASGTDRFALSGSRVTANGYTPLTGWLRNTTQVPVELQPRNVAGTPQTVSDRSGEADVLWRGTDNRLWTIGYRNLRWAPQSTAITTSNNVPLASDPTVVSTGPGKIDAFWQGNDSNLWHSHYTAGYFGSGSWSLPDSLSSGSSVQSAPSAVSVGGGAVDIFWKGPGGTLYADRYNGTNSSFLPISGTALVSTPYAVAIGNGAAEVFWRGSGNNLWSDTVTPWASGSPRLLAWAALGSDPAPVSDGQGNVDVFWRGSDGTLWHMAQTSGSWRATGQISSQPIVGNTTAVETSPGSITAVVQRTDGDLAAAVTIPSGGFVGPELLGDGPVGSNPTAVAYSQSAIYVYWRGLDSGLWYSPACPGCGQVPSVGTALS
jgi:surface antigen